MRNFFSLSALAVVLSVLLLGGQPARAGAPDTVLSGILDKMSTAGKQLRTLKASITQQKKNTQIGINGPVESGTIYFHPLAGGKYQLRIDYSSPEQKTVVVDGDKFFLYQPNLNQMVRSTLQHYAKTNSASGISLRFDASLKAQYNISYIRDENVDGAQTSVLSLVPKPGVSAPFKRQEWWVSHSSWLPIKIQITEKNSDVTWVRLGNMQPNVGIPSSMFSVKPRPGTNVIAG